MEPDLNYPELLALWKTVPLEWRIRFRKYADMPLALIQDHKPGVRLTYQGKPTKYTHKPGHFVAVGPALAVILDRPELARLKGGADLALAKRCWDGEQNDVAKEALKRAVEARLGYQCEAVEVTFWSSDERRCFRVRSGHRGHALRAIEKVLTTDEFDDIWAIHFFADDEPACVDLAADPQYWP